MRNIQEAIGAEPSETTVTTHQATVTYAWVEVGPEGVAELDQRGRVVFVPRDRIVRITLCKGIAAERPLLHVFFALICFAVAALALLMILKWTDTGGMLYAETASGLALIPLGVGILWNLLRRRHFLRVETPNDVRHLLFRGRIEHAELRRFLAQIEATQSLLIERAIPGFDRASPYRDA